MGLRTEPKLWEVFDGRRLVGWVEETFARSPKWCWTMGHSGDNGRAVNKAAAVRAIRNALREGNQ